MGKLIWTIVSVLIAVGVFSALWVGANLLFSQVSVDFRRFSALAGGIVGALFMTVIDGNNLITGIGDRPATFELGSLHVFLFWPVVGGLLGAAIGYGLSMVDAATTRLAIGIGGGVAFGLILAFTLKTRYLLSMRTMPMITWTVALTVLGVVLGALRRRNLLNAALTGGFFGWILGSFGGALQGIASNRVETILACVVAGAVGGARLGMTSNPDVVGKANIDNRSRSWLFVGPAFLFIAVMLIVPAIQTLILSVQSNKPADPRLQNYTFVGADNYQSIFTNPKNFDTSRFGDIWGSAILPWAAFFIAAGVLLAIVLGRETKQGMNFGGAPLMPLMMGIGLFSFALFTHLRGTIINNIWWVVAVTSLSTALGLTVAKLADGAKFEPVAKSFVFMPMAISFVGASIIWRLMMYQARDASKAQTGLLNAIWVWLGKVTTESTGKVIIGGIFLLAAAALLFAMVRSLSESPATAGLYGVLSVIPLWVAYRTFGDGIGGYIPIEGGPVRANPINFVQGIPFNNFWLMMILIWVQTGFAMVILSAAIKAVPEDFIEAAKIDGATDGQIFWRITVPQILPTIGVVATTIMVNVMKVFDIVKVTTNGQFDTQVLANAMYSEAFQFGNRGIGAALAMVLFLGILPVMVFNIYNLTKED